MKHTLRTIATASWLGWQIQANWASPWLFVGYSVVKPVTASFILVAMYLLVAGTHTSSPKFAYIFLGNTFYSYIYACLTGLSSSLIEDRERFQTLRYLYVAPISPLAYIVGRALPMVVGATVAVTVNLVVGWALFRIDVVPSQPFMLLVSMFLGLITTLSMGVVASALSIVVARHSYFLGEAIAGSAYLVSGAVFPIDLLPRPIATLAAYLPTTLWLEGVRRSFGITPWSATLQGRSDTDIIGLLAAAAIASAFLAPLSYRWCEGRAKETGMLDSLSNY